MASKPFVICDQAHRHEVEVEQYKLLVEEPSRERRFNFFRFRDDIGPLHTEQGLCIVAEARVWGLPINQISVVRECIEKASKAPAPAPTAAAPAEDAAAPAAAVKIRDTTCTQEISNSGGKRAWSATVKKALPYVFGVIALGVLSAAGVALLIAVWPAVFGITGAAALATAVSAATGVAAVGFPVGGSLILLAILLAVAQRPRRNPYQAL